jgi:hypothetical protein
LGEGSSQKYFGYGLGPKKILVLVLVKKNFGPCKKKIFGLGPGQKKKFGPGPGPLCSSLIESNPATLSL